MTRTGRILAETRCTEGRRLDADDSGYRSRLVRNKHLHVMMAIDQFCGMTSKMGCSSLIWSWSTSLHLQIIGTHNPFVMEFAFRVTFPKLGRGTPFDWFRLADGSFFGFTRAGTVLLFIVVSHLTPTDPISAWKRRFVMSLACLLWSIVTAVFWVGATLQKSILRHNPIYDLLLSMLKKLPFGFVRSNSRPIWTWNKELSWPISTELPMS